MTTIIRDNTNTPRTVTEVVVRDDTNTPRTINEIRVRDSNNVSRVVYSTSPPLSVTLTLDVVAGYAPGTGIATTQITAMIPAGGTPPYTYLWTFISGTSTPTINTPTQNSTNFTETSLVGNENAIFRGTVTDSLSATASADVNAFFIVLP